MLTGFFETMSSQGALPLSDILAIGEEAPNKHGVMLRKVYLRNPTRTVETFAHEYHSLLARPIQLIPALAGTALLRWDVSLNPPEMWREPVIAWALCLDGETRPVTPNGVNGALGGPTYVEMPCGKVEAVGEWTEPCGFDDADHLLKYFVAQRDRAKAAEASTTDEEQS